MLEVKNIKLFSESNNVQSFKVNKGEGLQVKSKSGGGKTKLFKIITGLLTPLSGDVMFDGKSIYYNDFYQLAVARKKIGAIFENPTILSNLSMRGNIEFVLQSKGRNWSDETMQLIDNYELRTCLDSRPVNLSRGQILNFNFLNVILCKPKFIFIDDLIFTRESSIEKKFIDYLNKYRSEFSLVYMGKSAQCISNLFDTVISLEQNHLAPKESPDAA